MNERKSRRSVLITVLALILLAALFFLVRCVRQPKPAPASPQAQTTPTPAAPAPSAPSAPSDPEPAEVLTPATLTGPARVTAGAEFQVSWTGPNNAEDFVTIVLKDAPPTAYASHANTKLGAALTLTAPMDATGSDAAKAGYELRYVTGKSRTLLGRAPIEVVAAGAAIDAPAEAVVGSTIDVRWTGPNNKGDYITITPPDWTDEKYGPYADTSAGSPLSLRMLADAGAAELRYVSGQGRKVLARRPITLVPAQVTLTAPDQAVAGSTISIAWTGPNNSGDYITIVEPSATDEKYGNYTNTSAGAPLNLLMPIMNGKAELRYVMEPGRKVLARRAISIVPAVITLLAPEECRAGEPVSITWTGPNHAGDYITIVPKSMPDEKYAAYANTNAGSPLRVNAPKEAGDAEIRFVAGQGGKVLSRRAIRVK